jgi:gliding motility-associated-like protein
VEKGCDQEFVTLDGTGSSPGTYTWTNEAGEVISSELSVQVSDPGTYLLTVFDPASNCENSDSVEVVSAVSPGAAQAQVDHDPCSIDAMLIGNLPTGTSGVWTSLTGANIADPAAATTQATGLKAGENIFIWTLSIGSCIDFAADTVSLEISKGAPDAANDAITLTPDQGNEVTVNVLENDEYSEINFTLVTDSLSIGAVKATDKGVITYIKEKCFANQVQILYEICDAICPELCDTAALVVKVEKNEAENCDAVPNGITPNGDGVNDQLVFDLLLNNPPDAFPDNEIIIFNRWGDVVFQAKPYLNDWSGRNKGGHELPQGTYYYILRLNIADGEIIRGDITVLK